MAPRYLCQEYLDNLNLLFTKGDWKTLLQVHRQGGEEERALLWPTPDEEDLNFIVNAVKEKNKESIVSIGCGTGLLEWSIQQSTGFQVYGVEVDRKYWNQAKSRGRVFLDAIYPEDDLYEYITTTSSNAIMFCYFNNHRAFQAYLDKYKGDCLIIIAPHNACRHTEPGPFDPSLEATGWRMIKCKEIRDTKDFIVIYERNI